VLAFALNGPVNVLAAQVGNRLVAILAVYGFVALAVIGGLALLGGPFVREATALSSALPAYAVDLQARAPELQSSLGQLGVQTDLEQLKVRLAAALEQGGTDVLGNLIGVLAEVGAVMLDIVLALVISVYLLIDGPRLRARSLALLPIQHRSKLLFLEDHVSRVLGAYLRGQFTLAVIIGVAAGVGTALLGLPYAVVLGVLAGLFELVPMFGPILSVIPALIVALFMPFPTVVWVFVFFLAVQQVENNILAPRISGHAVGLHPLGAMFALLAGFQLAGLVGALFAVPLAGVLWVLLAAAYRNAIAEPAPTRNWALPRWRRRRDTRSDTAGTARTQAASSDIHVRS
jgi:predicted PurR-regulated permease PerM